MKQHEFVVGATPNKCDFQHLAGHDNVFPYPCSLPASAECHQVAEDRQQTCAHCDGVLTWLGTNYVHRDLPTDCIVFASQPPAKTIAELAGELANEMASIQRPATLKRLLIAFAEEIQRRSVEP